VKKFGHVVTLSVLLCCAVAFPLAAQTFPLWNNGSPACGNAVSDCVDGGGHTPIKPAAWPAECGANCGTGLAPAGSWVPYSWGTTYPDSTLADKNPINDQRVQDPSNGGTTPQNYVSVSSGCPDGTQPSIYYYYDSVNKIIFFRWRVEQIANNYATGPSPGSYSSSNPWNYFFRDNQKMNRSLRIDVVECHDLVVFEDELGRDFAGNNLFKDRHRIVNST